MTNEEIRIAVAEEMGWTRIDHKLMGSSPAQSSDAFGNYRTSRIPNYPESLDACAEFEKTLNDDEWYAYYYDFLYDVVRPSGSCHNVQVFRATARQRCEAFLRLRNRWKD